MNKRDLSLPLQYDNDKNEILRGMTIQKIDEDKAKSPILTWYKKKLKLEKIKQLLIHSSYDIRDVYDSAFVFYSRFYSCLYIAYIISQRFRFFKTFILFLPLALYQSFFHEPVAFQKGLLKKALYGNDALSQECRILNLFFFPHGKYEHVINERTHHFRSTSLEPK